MNISAEKTDDCQLKLTVEVDQERVDQQLKAAARRLAGKARIPGFRKGKAPYNIVVRMLGKDVVYDEALEVLGQEVYREAMEQGTFKPYAQASLNEVTYEPMVLKFTVPLEPEVNLNDYRAIRIDPEKIEISDERLEQAVEQARDEKAEWRHVERALAAGDMAGLQIVIEAEDAELFNGAHSTVVNPGTDAVGPGFAEAVLGMEIGETRSFELTYPDTWADPSVAGKTVSFEVTLDSVQEKILPDLNDEFAAMVGDYASLDDFRARLRQDLQGQEEHEALHRYEHVAVEKLAEVATVCYPPAVLEAELDRVMDELDARIRREQNVNLDDYLKMTKQDKAQVRENLKPVAARRLKESLVLSELALKEKLTVTPDELREQERALMSAFSDDAQGLQSLLASPQGQTVVFRDIVARKAVERLTAIARGEAPELPAEEQPLDVAGADTDVVEKSESIETSDTVAS